jgi:hypothetical protein
MKSAHNRVLERLEARLAGSRLEDGDDKGWDRPVRVDLEVLGAADEGMSRSARRPQTSKQLSSGRDAPKVVAFRDVDLRGSVEARVSVPRLAFPESIKDTPRPG